MKQSRWKKKYFYCTCGSFESIVFLDYSMFSQTRFALPFKACDLPKAALVSPIS